MIRLPPNFPRPRFRAEPEYCELFSLTLHLGREPSLRVAVGGWAWRFWVGHAWDCDCPRCIPF
jgi:hypothetical protein